MASRDGVFAAALRRRADRGLRGKPRDLDLLPYIATTLLNSFVLKCLPILDGFALASRFTLRLRAGVFALAASPSHRLLVFAMFLFALLSCAKRHTEVRGWSSVAEPKSAVAATSPIDLPLIFGLGMATGIAG